MMTPRDPGFRICDQKGFHITFANGWTVSVQFGRGNYSSNYDFTGEWGGPVPPSGTAEVAAWPDGGEMMPFDGGDTVLGHQTPAEVLALMIEVAAKPLNVETAS